MPTDALKIGIGALLDGIAAAPTLTSVTLDESGDTVEGFIAMPPGTLSAITHIGCRTGALTGTPPNYKVSVQGVSNGRADGTIKQGSSTECSVSFAPGVANDWDWKSVAGTGQYTPTSGEKLAIVIKYDSGTIDGSNNAAFISALNLGTNFGFPFSVSFNATGSVVTKNQNIPVVAVKLSDGRVIGFPVQAVTSQNFNSGTGTADEYGMKFTVPAGIAYQYQVRGFRFFVAQAVAGASHKCLLYDGTTAIQQCTQDSDDVSTTSARWSSYSLGKDGSNVDLTTLPTLNGGTAYRGSLQPQDTSNITVYIIDVESQSDWKGWDGETNIDLCKRLDAGAWTDEPTRRIFGRVVLETVTQQAGGGAGPLIGTGRLVRN